ncbi:uncharacterized PE-PGRS family protein PE_PGRS10-like [Sabethes cyaneus]|uniref:uncharacterized PE-PGRS family protein PE_PGRS10-like n=1 Tax=Sabethes cyaneus TaxID=53552 RepID=UPI00237E412F|nr:uncharacterized PE-PGRS family protein PE_PGRS10-like [Sabethes cyaneus]
MPRCYIVKKQSGLGNDKDAGRAIPYGRLATNGLLPSQPNGSVSSGGVGNGSGHVTIISGTSSSSSNGSSTTEVGNVIVKHSSAGGNGGSPLVSPGGVICSPSPASAGNVIILNSVSVISGGPGAIGNVIGASGTGIIASGGGGMSGTGGGVIQRLDENGGPTSPTEACVAPVYYTNIAEHQNGKLLDIVHECN